MGPTDTFCRARDLLFAERDDYAAAYAKFRWPEMRASLTKFGVMTDVSFRTALVFE